MKKEEFKPFYMRYVGDGNSGTLVRPSVRHPEMRDKQREGYVTDETICIDANCAEVHGLLVWPEPAKHFSSMYPGLFVASSKKAFEEQTEKDNKESAVGDAVGEAVGSGELPAAEAAIVTKANLKGGKK